MDLDLSESYVLADDLWEWQKEHFSSFSEYKDWLKDNNTDLLEEERMYRVLQSAISGLVQSSAKGVAASAVQLKSLMGLSQPVGRPRGSTNTTEEHRINILANELKAYEADVERLTDN